MTPTPAIRLIFVEGDAVDVEPVLAELARCGRPILPARVATRGALENALAGAAWDLALCSDALVDLTVPDILAEVRRADADLPLIVISAAGGEARASDWIAVGANDCVPRDNLTRLTAVALREIRQAELRRTLRGAERSARHLAAIVESTNEAVIAVDLNDVVVSWNRAAERLYGWTAEEIVGRPISLLSAPDAPDLSEVTPRILRGEVIAGLETRRRHKSGAVREISLTVSPIFNAQGELIGSSRIAHDISERREIEARQRQQDEALRQSELQYRVLADCIPQLVWVAAGNGDLDFFNRQCYDYTGLPFNEIAGWNWAKVVHPDDWPSTLELWTHALTTGEPLLNEFRLRRFDGAYRWFLNRGVPLKDETGQVVRWIGTCTDIEDQRQASEAMRASEARFKALVEKSFDGVLLLDAEGNIRYASPGVERIAGRRRDEFLGRPFREFMQAHDNLGLPTWEELLVQPGESLTREGRWLRPDGSWRYVESIYTNLLDDPHVGRVVVNMRDISERKAAEDTLARDALLLASVRDAVIVTDLDGIVTYWNEGAARLLGWSADEMIGRRYADRFPEPQRSLISSEIVSRIWGPEWEGEYEDVRRDGSSVWVYGRVSELRDPQGRPIGILGLLHDVSERKAAEAERDALLERLRLQIDRMPLAFVLMDPQLRYVQWNPAAEKLFGYREAEILGKTPFETTMAPQSRQVLQRRLEQVMRGDMNAHGQTEHVTRDGRTIVCEWHNTPLMSPSGELVGIFCLGQDVTDRQRAQEALRLRDRAIQNVAQGIVITDAQRAGNPIIYVSPGFERMTGYTADEACGRTARFLQGPETDRAAVRRLSQAIADFETCKIELLNYKKDGSSFWNEVSVSPVFDGERLTHFVGVLSDVTDRRRLEEHFRQAQKMEAIGRLAGGVAHDFNNVLTIINGYSDLLLEAIPPSDPNHELLVEIRKAGERSAALTQQLLAFSRKQVVAARVIDVGALVMDAEKMLRRLIGEDVQLITQIDPTAGFIKADPGQIHQVIINLCVNARDAMPSGGQLRIETGRQQIADDAGANGEVPPGDYVVLTVADTGVGMTPEVLSRIWEPFFTTKGLGKGTGLGLPAVHGIVSQAGGHIVVVSKPGQGATFRIYLPRCAQPAPVRAPSVSKLPPRGNETVLLAEDDDGVRLLARQALLACGYQVFEAHDGPSALEFVESFEERIDLLITDAVMPGMNGRQLAEAFSQVHPESRVLYISGYNEDAVVRHGVLHDDLQFLQKPFAPRVLAERVRDILNQAPPALSAR